MEKIKLRRLVVVAAIVALPFAGDAQLLKGKAEGMIRDLQVGISRDGDQGATEYKTLELKDDGTFEFDAVLESPFNDVTIFVNDEGIVGAHLEQGKTLEVTLRQEKSGALEYAFRGEGRTLSEFYTRFARAFQFYALFSDGIFPGRKLCGKPVPAGKGNPDRGGAVTFYRGCGIA